MTRRLLLPLALLLGALALVAAGCGGRGAIDQSGSADTGATIVPASAPAFVALDTNVDSEQWQKVNRLLDRFPGRTQLLASIRKSLLQEAHLDFDKDVRPALGPGIDFVWLDFANNGSDVVGLTQPKDEDAFAKLVAKGNASDKSGNPLLTAKIGGWTVLSDKRALLDRVRTEYESSAPKLADDATFKEAFDGQPSNTIVKAYVNGATITKLISDAIGKGLQTATPQDRKALACTGVGKLIKPDAIKWIAGAVDAKDDAAEFDVQAKGSAVASQVAGAQQPFAPPFADQIPSGALLYVGFGDYASGLQQLRKQCPQFDKQLGLGLQGLGLSLDQLANLFAGGGAIYVRPAALGPIPEITAVLAESDLQQAQATVDTLVRKVLALTGAPMRAVPTTVDGVAAKRLNFGRFSVYYAAFDGKLVITDSTAGISGLKDGGAKLQDDKLFKQTADDAGLPDKSLGLVYVNLRDAIPLIENYVQASGSPVPDQVQQNLAPLQAALFFSSRDGDTATVKGFVSVK